MKLGFVSAILDGWNFEEMIDTAAAMGFRCVEVACWPSGKAERRYAGVSHINVDEIDDAKVAYIKDYCAAGNSVIISTHDVTELEICSRLLVLKGGKLSQYVYDGDPNSLARALL